MKKKELLDKINNSILKNDCGTKDIYREYYSKIENLLFGLPDDIKIADANGNVPVSISQFPKDLDIFVRDNLSTGEGIARIGEFFETLYTELRTWKIGFIKNKSEEIADVEAIKTGWYNQRAKRRKIAFIVTSVILVSFIVTAAVLAILEYCGVVKSGGIIGVILSAVGVVFDVVYNVIERASDLKKTREVETDAAAVVAGSSGKREFVEKYKINNGNHVGCAFCSSINQTVSK